MMPVKKKTKRKRRGNDNEEEEEEKKTKFLFFDLKCMQETGVHVPNLVVVQDDEGHEWVFKGANTCKDSRTFAIGCLVPAWTGLCAFPTTSKGMIRISF